MLKLYTPTKPEWRNWQTRWIQNRRLEGFLVPVLGGL